jgi:hypothetical protein
MKRKRFRKGIIVEVEFLDHVEDSDSPLTFTVFGRIVDVQRKFLVIESWTYSDPKTPKDSNNKTWVILRSTITDWFILERK